MSFRYAIDSVAYRDGLVYGWGWYLHDAAPARRITLELLGNDGVISCVRCGIDRTREDVAHVFTLVSHATSSGIIFQGKIPRNFEGKVLLKVELANGELLEHDVAGFPQSYTGETFEVRVVGGQLRRGLRHLRAGRWSVIVDRLRRITTEAGKSFFSMAEKKMQVQSGEPFVLVIDHQLGGGANKFSLDKLEALKSEGRAVAYLRFNLPRLQYELSCQKDGTSDNQVFLDLASALGAIAQLNIAEIIVNNLVSYPEPRHILEWARSIKSSKKCTLRFYLHDFFAVCPTWTLINANGVFCQLPKPDVCRQCLAAMPAYFPSFIDDTDIAAWRRPWSEFIDECDDVVAFSQSTLDLYARAFPDSTGLKKARVEPHRLNGPALAKVEPRLDGILTIAVIGNISVQKGARIVKEMARLIMQNHLDARIVILGSLDEMEPSPCLEVLGPYQTHKLPELLARENTSVCLLPSICPETFSYATSEIMQMQLPVAVFDLGAPAERVRNYADGVIIDTLTAEAALAAIFKLRDQLAERRIEHFSK